MKKEEYQIIVNRHLPKEDRGLNLLKAFFFGGLIGVIANFLIDIYSYLFNISSASASGLMIVTLIFIACLLTALGVFDKMVHYGRMGLIIPITGFAHSVQSATLDYKNEGLIHGFGSNMLKLAGSVIIYGTIAGVVLAFIRLIFFGGM